MPYGNVPTLACALTTDGWYSWCSGALVGNDTSLSKTTRNSLADLISLETTAGEFHIPEHRVKEKMVIGHNVCYDRARIKEQYFLEVMSKRIIGPMSSGFLP